MRSEQHVQLSVRECGQYLLLILCRDHAAQQSGLEREIVQTLAEVAVVLLGKDCRGCKERHLLAAHDGFEGRTEGDFRLSVSDVSADQAVHDMGTLHVVLYVLDAGQLVLGLVVLELGLEPELPVVVPVESETLAVLAPRIERDKLGGQVLRALACLGLLVLPARGSELVYMRRLTGRTDVALDQVRLLDGNVEVLVACELYLDVVALAHPIYLQEDSDSVVHMYDVIAFVELHEAVQGRCLRVLQRLDDLLPAPEYLVLTEDDEPRAAD